MGQSTKPNNCSRRAEPSDPEKVYTPSPNIGSQMSKEKDLAMVERREGVVLKLLSGVSDDQYAGPHCFSSESDRYTRIDDDIMSSQQCETRAVVSEARHTDPEINRRIKADFQGFDPPEYLELCTACIFAEAARMRARRHQQGVSKAKHNVTRVATQDHALKLSGVPRDMQAVKRSEMKLRMPTGSCS
ncbi:MAG: hypothetical protein EZS28_011154 [Streblomastix strix]|uniref:Uncharacterized protein n=1 Tax=Streblomastix strix TaxID=222440 RepID=A0A5J4WEZ4_9EUKA|nr:MAG: hypothetical protein EZS28_011154 [Streblomastix strix]